MTDAELEDMCHMRATRLRDVVCAECGRTDEEDLDEWGRGLHVHHKKKEKGVPCSFRDCVLLCYKCHCKAHGRREPVHRIPKSKNAMIRQRVRKKKRIAHRK